MRTLHLGLRVADVERSLAFYATLGYEVVGSVAATSLGDLTMIKLPDDPFVTIELVSRSSANASSGGSGLSHFVGKVESMDTVVAGLAAEGIHPDEPPVSPDGSNEFPDRMDHRPGWKTGSSSCSGHPTPPTAWPRTTSRTPERHLQAARLPPPRQEEKCARARARSRLSREGALALRYARVPVAGECDSGVSHGLRRLALGA
jgi:lactoylglutathione lyase